MLDIFQKIKIYGLLGSIQFAMSEIYRLIWMGYFHGSFSQQGEDLIIDALLGNKKNGYYIDVGAHDPERFSNTKRFYRRGWNGINIEPNPLLIEKFEKFRPRDKNLALGVGANNGLLEFFEFFPSTLSTFSINEANVFKNQGYRLNKQYKVPIKTLAVITEEEKIKEVDFLSVDTEGTDLEVLKSNDWKKIRPRVICVETNKDDLEIAQYLEGMGYKLMHNNGINSIYSV